jgi:hypothetical protein
MNDLPAALDWLRVLWPSAQQERRRAWHRVDTVVAVLFAVIAVAFARGLWTGDLPYMGLDGDSAQVASYCAAIDHPRSFPTDPLLADPKNYAFYETIQLPIARAVTRLLKGDYGTAFLLPAPFLLLLQGLGYYRLGHVLYKSRIVALGLSLSTFLYYPIDNLGDYWGTNAIITPRDWFQAALPFLLAYQLAHRDEPRVWVESHFLLGLLIYVHPPSTPTWAVALWVGTWFLRPKRFTFRQRVSWMALCAGAFFLAAVPFASHYLHSFQHGATENYEAVYRITKARYSSGYLDIPSAFHVYWELVSGQSFTVVAAAGAVVVWITSKRERRTLYAVVAWIVSLGLISFVFPYYEQAYARPRRLMPVEVDFVRSCRYTVVLLQALCLWPLSLLARKSLRRLSLGPFSIRFERVKQALLFAAVGALFLRQAELTPADRHLMRGFRDLREGRLLDSTKSPRALMLDAVRQLTPEGAKLMVTDYRLASAVRYYALRQVAWSYKDGGAFAYSNHRALIEWGEERVRMETMRRNSREGYLDALLSEARRLRAGYALLDGRFTPEQAAGYSVRVVFSDGFQTLLQL